MTRRQWFFRGMHAGIPISLGYFAVSIALGITARQAGIAAAVALLVAIVLAWLCRGLFTVATASCLTVLLLELFL